jgi:agmatine deiminase
MRCDAMRYVQVIGIQWRFNAWGGETEGCYWPCHFDRALPPLLCADRSIALFPFSEFVCQCQYPMTTFPLRCLALIARLALQVMEGGSIHVDGEGTLITTEECLLNANRNPSLTREQIERCLKLTLGVSKV